MKQLISLKDCKKSCNYPEGHMFYGRYLHKCKFCGEAFLAEKRMYWCFECYNKFVKQ